MEWWVPARSILSFMYRAMKLNDLQSGAKAGVQFASR